MNELEWFPKTLTSIIQSVNELCRCTTHPTPHTYVCINQPDSWWEDPSRKEVCQANTALLAILEKEERIPLTTIDHCTRGRGWEAKKSGVGMARKVVFDKILEEAAPNDIIVSMDADTTFPAAYLQGIIGTMGRNPDWVALSAPYYHNLSGVESLDRSMLRYEIYMRNYALNMLRINSPYAFTALGSAIVVRAGALRKIGNITPLQSGEDFYLLQKLCKMGTVGTWAPECVHPATRISNRVIFGTGPAIQSGLSNHWESYPIYSHFLFEKIAETYHLIEQLYSEEIETAFLQFLQHQFKSPRLWDTIRANTKNSVQFKRAFHEKADGLRILQYLKSEQKRETRPDAHILRENLQILLPEEAWVRISPLLLSDKDLADYSTEALNQIRDVMFEEEMHIRSKNVKTDKPHPPHRIPHP